VRGSGADSGMMVKARIGRKRDYAEQLRRIGASISCVGVEESGIKSDLCAILLRSEELWNEIVPL
jgi:hypothetical protein